MNSMDRRKFVAITTLGGVLSLAGCPGLSSDSESAEYEQSDKESLLPDRVGPDWPDQNLQVNNELNEDFERVFTTPDGNLTVMMGVTIHGSVSAAEDAFERAQATASDADEYSLADEGLVYEDGDFSRCTFRHSNAIGEALAMRYSVMELVPDQERATTYAEILFQHWQEG